MTEAATAVLGFGNDIAGNDAVGLEVVRAVKERLPGQLTDHVVTRLSSESYLAVLELLFDFETIVVVDAIPVEGQGVGQVTVGELGEVADAPRRQAHGCGLARLVGLTRQRCGEAGARIVVVGIGVPALPYVELSEEMDRSVAQGVEEACATVLSLINHSVFERAYGSHLETSPAQGCVGTDTTA